MYNQIDAARNVSRRQDEMQCRTWPLQIETVRVIMTKISKETESGKAGKRARRIHAIEEVTSFDIELDGRGNAGTFVKRVIVVAVGKGRGRFDVEESTTVVRSARIEIEDTAVLEAVSSRLR